MSDAETDNAKPRRNGMLCIAIVVLVTVLICLLAAQCYQSITSTAALQGYWHIQCDSAGEYYMLIDDNLIEIIDTAGPKILHADTNVQYKYKSLFAMKSHRYTLYRSSNDAMSTIDPMFDGRELTFQLYPVIGTIHIHDKDGNELQMVKNNQYSLDHLAL